MTIFKKKKKEPVRLHKKEPKKPMINEMAIIQLGVILGIILLILLLIIICSILIPPTQGFYWW